MDDSYLLISPCRNEAEFMVKTLDSVVSQSLRPAKWIIVDDGSTDATPAILRQYSKKYDFIEIVTRNNRGHRSVGPGVIEAFYAGLAAVELTDYQYVCKLDLDLIMPPRYFERMIERMDSEPRLGTCSGKAYFRAKDSAGLCPEECSDESSIGAAKFYRVACFKQIGGFVRQVMWDGIDSHRCRLLGWISLSWDEEDIRFIHLRPMGSSQAGILTGRVRHGFGQYYMGTGIAYILASTVYRLNKRPYISGALAMLWGYIKSALGGVDRLKDPEMIRLMNRYQWQCLLSGKKKATAMLNEERAGFWQPLKKGYDIPYKG
jgi:glycosyltransferase involved in cell wall biosynthesis|tara:strand:+ start:33 stop:986 length:954 start_codon:yes stop_codon:yes gene_type:complete